MDVQGLQQKSRPCTLSVLIPVAPLLEELAKRRCRQQCLGQPTGLRPRPSRPPSLLGKKAGLAKWGTMLPTAFCRQSIHAFICNTDALVRRSEETWPPRPGKREVACWIRVMRQHDEVDSRRVRRSVATELSEDLAFQSICHSQTILIPWCL